MRYWFYAITFLIAYFFFMKDDGDDDEGGGTLVPIYIPTNNERHHPGITTVSRYGYPR